MNPQNNIVAGIDVHKRILVVVVLNSSAPDRDHATARFGTAHQQRQELVEFLRFHQVSHVAMESTAQYWRPVWMDLEGEFPLTLAQARSTHAPRGRKQDLSDARRIARRLLSGDLTRQLRARPRAARVATAEPHSRGHAGKRSTSAQPD